MNLLKILFKKKPKYGICSICGKELEEHGWVYERPSRYVDISYLFKKVPKYHIKCLRGEI